MRDESAILIEFLAGADAECDACGHGLRGIAAPRCPECGRQLRLAVRAKNHSFAPWLFAVVSIAFGAGFDGVVTTVMTVVMIFFPPPGPRLGTALAIMGCFAVGTAVQLGLIVFVARRRHSWGRLPFWKQWLRSGMIAAAVFLVHVTPPAWIAWVNR